MTERPPPRPPGARRPFLREPPALRAVDASERRPTESEARRPGEPPALRIAEPPELRAADTLSQWSPVDIRTRITISSILPPAVTLPKLVECASCGGRIPNVPELLSLHRRACNWVPRPPSWWSLDRWGGKLLVAAWILGLTWGLWQMGKVP